MKVTVIPIVAYVVKNINHIISDYRKLKQRKTRLGITRWEGDPQIIQQETEFLPYFQCYMHKSISV